MIEAKMIADSIGQHSPRLLTIRAVSPKFIHQETLRHRLIYIEDALRGDPDFSFSVSSARAIPFKKLLEEVRSDELRAVPVKWGAEQKGMSPGDELDDIHKSVDWFLGSDDDGNNPAWESITFREAARREWRQAALTAAAAAERMTAIGVHKSIVNRVIEPYIHCHALMTATAPGWLNFFGLRLDGGADPTVRALAEACWVVWNESEPKLLRPGEWHLPFVNEDDLQEKDWSDNPISYHIKVSVARCARLTFNSFETGKISTIEEDLKLYDRLVGSVPLHASPAEHIAAPDTKKQMLISSVNGDTGIYDYAWNKQHLHGNLPGWQQYRKMLPGEALAPIPTEYAR